MLERLLATAPLPGEIERPARLLAAMRHGVLAGGKRLRPFLVVETARALGETGEGPLRAGAAIELLHCYSLIHDDLPAMDDDDLRRGRPTVHKAFDEATAILAGDALLTLAFDVMGDLPTHPDGAIRAALCVGLARASGLGGMAGGQMLDLAAESAPTPLDGPAIERLQAMKTGRVAALFHRRRRDHRPCDAAGARVAVALRRRARRGLPDRRRHSRRTKATKPSSASAPARTPRATRRPTSPPSASTTPRPRGIGLWPRRRRRSTKPASARRATFCARRRCSSRRARIKRNSIDRLSPLLTSLLSHCSHGGKFFHR